MSELPSIREQGKLQGNLCQQGELLAQNGAKMIKRWQLSATSLHTMGASKQGLTGNAIVQKFNKVMPQVKARI